MTAPAETAIHEAVAIANQAAPKSSIVFRLVENGQRVSYPRGRRPSVAVGHVYRLKLDANQAMYGSPEWTPARADDFEALRAAQLVRDAAAAVQSAEAKARKIEPAGLAQLVALAATLRPYERIAFAEYVRDQLVTAGRRVP